MTLISATSPTSSSQQASTPSSQGLINRFGRAGLSVMSGVSGKIKSDLNLSSPDRGPSSMDVKSPLLLPSIAPPQQSVSQSINVSCKVSPTPKQQQSSTPCLEELPINIVSGQRNQSNFFTNSSSNVAQGESKIRTRSSSLQN